MAQDLHYSQFYGAPLHLNPALTGIFGGDVRFMGQYRNQWAKVPVGYTSFTGAVDFKVFNKVPKDNFLAFGVGFNHDIAGFSDLRLNALTINGAYTKKMGARFYGSLGGQLGYGNRRWASDQVTFDSQFDPTRSQFDPSNPNKEINNDQRLNFGDVGLGFNVRYQVKQSEETRLDTFGFRTKVDFGMGVFHLNRPNQFFTQAGSIRLPMRFTPYILSDLQIGNDWDLMVNVAGQFQSVYRQYLGGAGLRYHFDRRENRHFSMQLGVTWRFDGLTNDSATFPAIEARYNNIRAGFSYDVNLSRFNNNVEGGVGGPELFIHYHIARYKTIVPKKVCPLI